jgi:AhpD family alkylhydroperoxidase
MVLWVFLILIPQRSECHPLPHFSPGVLCYHVPMSTQTTEHPANTERSERSSDRPAQERRDPTYVFTEKAVAEKSEIARRFLDTRTRLNANVDKANSFLVKRFYNIDHNTYLEGALPAKTKELMGLVASACLRCDECIFYHAIQAYRLGVALPEQQESLNVALVVGGSIVIPHLRRAYELLEELYA